MGFNMGNCFSTWGKNDKAALANIILEYKEIEEVIPRKKVPVTIFDPPGKTAAVNSNDFLSLFFNDSALWDNDLDGIDIDVTIVVIIQRRTNMHNIFTERCSGNKFTRYF